MVKEVINKYKPLFAMCLAFLSMDIGVWITNASVNYKYFITILCITPVLLVIVDVLLYITKIKRNLSDSK